ncbi:HWE histidine kinase domain-containing protein [Hyphomonas pacifica]|uniref:histidine kinase n=1 Tax=Hyphomonas pacifica TaxID=1280941 RepID=A0A062U0W5_9PROT|nr:HWE histidine kinase domain-containing protein [Hyphomonas pacifica]KCZ50254.1 hypothetical protein HY2_14650 [Hyphomonas pacifica]RAN32513.1 hypothetical protein HY3_15105 [Hyphomonas pacifica]RAN36794.1 hypothetical protein HY11_11160 [Hyphomonas pacifica]
MSEGFIPQDTPVDLTNCDQEPIHIPGRIQAFGALISVSADWIINHVSRNISAFIGADVQNMVGTPLVEYIDEDAIKLIRSRLPLLAGVDAVERLFAVKLTDADETFDVAVHLSGRSIIIELERHTQNKRADYTSYVRPMIERIGKAETSEDLCEDAARQLRHLIGFDRVMVYQFSDDGSGEVIAESRRAGMDSFKGLHYPATDIPKQARKLYTRNLLRIIADVSDDGIEIVPTLSPEGEPLDLSLSGTRAVSPIHLEYLKNMGIEASLSISILRRGELWGLFACHHETPKTLSYDVRSAAELFGQLFAFVLEQKQSDEARLDAAGAQLLHDRLMSQLAEDSSIVENFSLIVEAIEDVIPYDGAIGWVEGEFQSLGHTPTKEEFTGLVKFLNTTAASRVYHTKNLSDVYPPARDFAHKAAGMLALPVSRAPRDYVVLFRREVVNSVTWAGNPQKAVTHGPNGARLTPRKSFEAWKEVVRNTSAPWTEAEVRAANSLRLTLLEVILRMADATVQERMKAQERQELLIAELNHRVRNILNLIKGLVNQSQAEARSVSEFTQVIGGRIHALARAHDQITDKKWQPTSVRELIETEAEAYLGLKASRVRIEGEDVFVSPQAFGTLSLVIHELMTNSAKYGALCDTNGSLRIALSLKSDGGLVIDWKEIGGPPITSQPTRTGFGTTIIERSIPYELGGKASLRYEMSGVEARFVVPEDYVSLPNGRQVSHKKSPLPEQQAQNKAGLSGCVMVLEDNIIIAMDAEQMLKQMGASDVALAADVSEALDQLEKSDITFALLDVNLGDETSEPVAEKLVEKNIPFVFATGYGDAISMLERFPNASVVKKPYNSITVERAIGKVV